MELKDFYAKARQSREAWTGLLQDLTEIDPIAITLLSTQARALSWLDDVEMYFNNTRIRRTVESLLNSFTTIVQAKEILRLAQPSPNLEALMKELEEKIINLNRNNAKVSRLEGFASVELAALVEHFHYVKA